MKENEVLARFHGWRHSPTPKGKGAGLWYFPEWNKAAFKSTCFLYDKSWDWLMPVWYKFNAIHVNNITDQHYLSACKYAVGNAILEKGCAEACKLLAQAIEWYNANKQL